MNLHLHPMQWFHHVKAEHMHTRSVWHSEVFWIVAVMLLTLIAIVVMAMVFGTPNPKYTPMTPFMSFPY